MTQPVSGGPSPRAKTKGEIIERDDRRLRTNTRHTTFTPEYVAWLKRQRAKRKGRT